MSSTLNVMYQYLYNAPLLSYWMKFSLDVT